jgi:septation ring formation regulator EzrA
LRDKIKAQGEGLVDKDGKINNYESLIKLKNDELEQRLENISKLIQKNEQLGQQVRVQKQRFEKFKSDQISSF